jgi:hypothetical protein
VNSRVPGENWHVECQDLPHEDVLKIGQVLKDVYESMEPDALKSISRTDHYQKLNDAGRLSAQYVSFVLNLKGSSLHKYFLLTSAHGIISVENISTMMELAEAKCPIKSLDLTAGKNFERTFLNLESFYILPGFTEQTENPAKISMTTRMNCIQLREQAVLFAFLSDKNSELVLEDHLAKDFAKSIQTARSLNSLASVARVRDVLKGRYRELALLLKPKDLLNLSTILNNVNGCEFSERFLIQIYSKLDHVNKPVNAYKGDSIARVMTLDEKAKIRAKAINEVDRFLRGNATSSKTQSIIYAAFAELFVRLGEDKGLEALNHFKRLHTTDYHSTDLYESIVGLIIEAIKPENRDFPFAWIAQLSDYAWVVSNSYENSER